ncbi:hypothetical protein K7X08_015523 [Anisodus acutangulus]|uniref:GTD-binding domain-containing protein n=1 Tax=Anisodus acutangulus TaxID=402998 RepID=A0A9Q1L2K6_9SOLA|nr:hypothetical protein K7X08_015523 [Anisodus acutangulus]
MANVRIARLVSEAAPPQFVNVMRNRASKMLETIKEDDREANESSISPKSSLSSTYSSSNSMKSKYFVKKVQRQCLDSTLNRYEKHCVQEQLIEKLYNELDEESEASASAASEALSMILRLQGEKAAEEMETEQYKRFVEEKMSHAEESLSILQELTNQKGIEKVALDYQANAYRYKLLSMGYDDDIEASDIEFLENLDEEMKIEKLEERVKHIAGANYAKLSSLPASKRSFCNNFLEQFKETHLVQHRGNKPDNGATASRSASPQNVLDVFEVRRAIKGEDFVPKEHENKLHRVGETASPATSASETAEICRVNRPTFELAEVERQSKRQESERHEELILLRDIKEQLNLMQSEIKTWKNNKFSPRYEPSVVSLTEKSPTFISMTFRYLLSEGTGDADNDLPSITFLLKKLSEPICRTCVELSTNAKRLIIIHDNPMRTSIGDVLSFPDVESYIFHSVPAFTRYSLFRQCIDIVDGDHDKILQQLQDEFPTMESCFGPYMAMFVKMEREWKLNSGEFINSCREVEGKYLDLLANESTGKKPLWAIGPLHMLLLESHDSGSSTTSHECLAFLDEQDVNSVIFVSFGTNTKFSQEQVNELAIGLEQSNHKFIWVIRGADKKMDTEKCEGKDGNFELPKGFQERVEGRGMVMRNWVPQLEILEHSSTGGFLSHCGWNSCLESIGMGVPIAAWPNNADQPYNAVFVTDVLRIGISVWS